MILVQEKGFIALQKDFEWGLNRLFTVAMLPQYHVRMDTRLSPSVFGESLGMRLAYRHCITIRSIEQETVLMLLYKHSSVQSLN